MHIVTTPSGTTLRIPEGWTVWQFAGHWFQIVNGVIYRTALRET